MNTNELDRIYIEANEVSRLYNGPDLIWQREKVLDVSLQNVLDYSNSMGYIQPTSENISLINDSLIVPIKQISGLWEKLDVLFLFANSGDERFRSINYIDPTNSGLSSSLTLSKHGFIGQGVAPSFFDTNFNPTIDGVNYTLDNASRGGYVFKVSDNAQHIIDSGQGNQNLIFNSNVSSHRINSGTAGVDGGTRDMSGLGFKSINRLASGSVTLYNNKVQMLDTRISSVMPNANQHVFRYGTNYGTIGISVYYMGAALTELENNSLADILDNYVKMLGPTAPILSTTEIEIVQGSTNTVTATVDTGETVVWKDELDNILYTGTTFTLPSSAEGSYTYYAYAINSSNVESEPTLVNVEVKSINNIVLVSPMHTYSKLGEDVTISYLSVEGVDIDYYDNTDTLIQSGGNLVLSGLTEGTHNYYAVPKSGATLYNQIPITIITLLDYPVVDFNVNYKLTIEDGLTIEEPIIYNEEVQPNKIVMLPKNTVVNNIILNNSSYPFSPKAISVILDSDKTITFIPNGI